jgi:hypothetical protein
MDGLEHAWETSSQHRTSEGVVRYQRCHCGLRRITVNREHVVADRVGVRRFCGVVVRASSHGAPAVAANPPTSQDSWTFPWGSWTTPPETGQGR